MITYKAAYTFEDGIYLGEVLDFPGAVSSGKSLDEARRNLAGALLDMAETNLELGEALPRPNPASSKPDADIQEPIYLVLQTSHKISVQAVPEAVA
jgi:predicted RNase H-like HicB family nuclease